MANFSAMQVIEDLQFIPTGKNKRPIPTGWQKAKVKYDLTNCPAIGVVCGAVSGNLEGIDFDLKYDLTGKLYEQYQKVVDEIDPSLKLRMVIQRTMNGGYHWIYRCSVIEGNQKLAQRPTTEEERQETRRRTYDAEHAKGTEVNKANAIAQKAFDNDTVRVLLETRGEGGFFACFPSEGYTLVHGDFQSISEITPEERDLLLSTARRFNQIVEEYKPANYVPSKTDSAKGLSPFDDYNGRGDVVGLMLNHGWTIVRQRGTKTHLLRSGAATSATSGNWDSALKRFSVFTTSTQFEPNKAYMPYAVYTIMEHSGDFVAARQALYDQGYGDREDAKRELNSKTPSKISTFVSSDEDDLPFLAKAEDIDPYLQKVLDGTFQMGKTTGYDSLDKYFRFKEGNLVMNNGHDNVGKTIVMLNLMMLASILHNWFWVIYSPENTIGSITKRLMEFYWGMKVGKMNPAQYRQAREFVLNHFKIIKDTEVYNYQDVMNMSERVFAKFGSPLKPSKYWNIFADPFNALALDVPQHGKLSIHDWKYQSLTEIKMFLKRQGCGMYINNHVVTEALRRTDEDGYPIAPQKADTEGGGMFANKADDFITTHRAAQHPINWMFTELHIRKIKETETGGQQTPLDTPVLLKMVYPDNCMFVEVDRTTQNERSPIRLYHNMKYENSVTRLMF